MPDGVFKHICQVIPQQHRWWLRHHKSFKFTFLIAPSLAQTVRFVRMLDVDDLAKLELEIFKCRHYGLYYYCGVPIRPICVNRAP